MLTQYKEVQEFKAEHKECALLAIPDTTSNSKMILHCKTHGSQISCRIPYNNFCLHPVNCAGNNSCPRNYACSE